MISRRAFVAAAFTAAGCRRRKASGYSGYAFIANQEGEAIAAVDLTVFAVARHIRVPGRPTDVIAHPRLPLVYALTPENGLLHEIRSDTLAYSRKLSLGSAAISMRLAPDGDGVYVLCRQPRKLVRVSVKDFRVEGQVGLPADPFDFDLDRLGQTFVVSYGPHTLLSVFGAKDVSVGTAIPTSGETGVVRFQSDSRVILAANRSDRMLTVYHVARRELMVNLPLSVRPDHLCFKADGGQLFVTGEGVDGVVVIYPYYTPYVAETVLAGHAPGAMAATLTPAGATQYLFVANPKSGDVSILNILKRRVVAVTPVGTEPSYITITPDDQYALVLNEGSGDMAVLRIANITRAVGDNRRSRKGPIFMMIPVGSRPVSAAVATI